MEITDSNTVSRVDTQNAGDDGSLILAPITVARIIPGRTPKMLPSRYFTKGIPDAPENIETASPGKKEMERRRKDKKKLLLC